MAVDFNKPVEADLYNNDVLTSIRDNIEAALLLAHTSGSNIPTGTRRLNDALTPPRFQEYNGSTWDDVVMNLATAGTIMLFGNSTAPAGWTRKADWTNNAMLTYISSGSVSTGGSATPKDGHAHSMSSHTHTGPSHTHTGPSHTHGIGTLKAYIGYITANGAGQDFFSWDSAGTPVKIGDRRTDLSTGGAAGAMDSLYSSSQRDYYSNSGTGATAADGTAATGASGTAATGGPSTANTAQNTTPIYQEVIAATKD